MSKITNVEIRMYRMGTGDCFALKFFAGKKEKFKMLIDAGTWEGSKEHLEPYIKNLKEYLNDFVDVLVVTHEHKDHVYAFDVCEDLFLDGKFNAGEIWMGWTENDKTKKVKDWKDDYGEKKKALGLAARKLEEVVDSDDFKKQFEGNKNSVKALGARKTFTNVLKGFADLHLSLSADKVYKGGLEGMEIAKKKIPKGGIQYFMPGDVMEGIPELDGVKIYVLGPPKLYEDVKKEAGAEGESYAHNKELRESGAFGAAVLGMDAAGVIPESLLPFDEHYIMEHPGDVKNEYDRSEWRKIDYDWLFSAGAYALRMNGLTNNLSLALAFEFEESKKVMLFPGDAEYGSWASWHKIKWGKTGTDGKHFTEDLLNRTVFYKVAHHLSHNGTAQRLGLEMMTSTDLVAMATLDYDAISEGWKSTMPNRAIIRELLSKTRGRVMIMKEDGLFFDFNGDVPLTDKIKEARTRMTNKEKTDFGKNFEETEFYLEYRLHI